LKELGMKRKWVVIGSLCLLAAGVPYLTMPAQALEPSSYQLVKSHIGPGQTVSSGVYGLSSSIGQAGAGQGSAGSYTLGGGFWGGGVIAPAIGNSILYVPLVIR
jgi:hypothetical protein